MPESENSADEAWAVEIARRLARFDAGEVQAIPVAEVLASLGDCVPANGSVIDESAFRRALREAEDDIEAGRIVSNSDVCERLQEWLKDPR